MLGDIRLYSSRFSQFAQRGAAQTRVASTAVEKFPPLDGPGLTAPEGGEAAAPVQLAALLDDIARYAVELERSGVEEPAVRARLAELNALRRNVEGFAATQSAQLRGNAEDAKGLLAALRNASAPRPQSVPSAESDSLRLSAEAEELRAERLARRLRTVIAKLDSLELLIGGRPPAQSGSLCVAVQEELRATAYLDPAAATDVLRRLELVAEEVTRQATDRRMNYFTLQQKQELGEFLAEFSAAREEAAAGREPNPVAAAVDALEANQPLLRRATRFFGEGQDMAEALARLRREGEENGAALEALRAQMAENCRVLEENLRLLKA